MPNVVNVVQGSRATEATLLRVYNALVDMVNDLALVSASIDGLVAAGEFTIDAATVADLKNVAATVNNFPADFPDAQVSLDVVEVQTRINSMRDLLNASLTTINSSVGTLLTDAQLRATDVEVNDDAAQTILSSIVSAVNTADTNIVSQVSSTGSTLDSVLTDIKRSVTDFEVMLDYDVRTDGNPVYVGKAANGTATAAASWVIQKLTYDGSSRLERVQVLSSSVWDNRASLGW